MPNVKLATGVDLYYETHGQGEPLIFVPSTAYSGDVWKPSQMPLAEFVEYHLSRPAGLRPVGGRAKRLHHRADGAGHRCADGSPETSISASDRPLDGRENRPVAGGKLSRASKELDHGCQRLRAGSPAGLGLCYRIAAPIGAGHGGDGLREISSITRPWSPTRFLPKTTAPRIAPKSRHSTSSPGRPTPSCRSLSISASRATTGKARIAWAT